MLIFGDKEELIEELMKEFMSSPPKSSVVIEEIEDKNAQPVVTAPKPRKEGKSCYCCLLQLDTARATTVTDLQQPAHDVLEENSEFDDSYDEDYVVDRFSDNDEYCMDDYVVEEEVQVEHEVGNEINTECEPSVATSKRTRKRRRQEEGQNVNNPIEEDFIEECPNYGNSGSSDGENEDLRNSHEWKSKFITTKWIVERSIECVKVDKNIKVVSIRQCIDEEFKIEISKYKAYAAIKITREMVSGSNNNQYAKVWNYAAELKRTHSDSTIEIVQEPFRARLENQQSRSEEVAADAPNTTPSSASPANPEKKRTNSRATRLYEEFGRAWLRKRGSRNRYSFERPLPKGKSKGTGVGKK
ncbi:hypothetical protein M9H77_33812 [Catharanthus roseus]|uniref:Uncharacterized protein n=1 Tax=Catharanthus roseus TaxID=4058 RepID=A0ACB9ZNN5_CATRO|nr:hypothetical protein M9H77_33812 [Catharanthus roseus]